MLDKTVPDLQNVIYFESASMRELYDLMKNWQYVNRKQYLSFSIHRDGENFCCIALINNSQELAEQLLQLHTKTKYEMDMARFQRKALKHIGVGVSFESDVIPREKTLLIQSKLEECTTLTEIVAVFVEESSNGKT